MAQDPSKANTTPTSIHDFVQRETPQALRTLQEGHRQRAVIQWVEQTLGGKLMQGISLEGDLHHKNGGERSQFDCMPEIIRNRLTQAGFADDAITTYLDSIEKQTTQKTLDAINQAMATRDHNPVQPLRRG